MWLVRELVKSGVIGADGVLMTLMKQIAGTLRLCSLTSLVFALIPSNILTVLLVYSLGFTRTIHPVHDLIQFLMSCSHYIFENGLNEEFYYQKRPHFIFLLYVNLNIPFVL